MSQQYPGQPSGSGGTPPGYGGAPPAYGGMPAGYGGGPGAPTPGPPPPTKNQRLLVIAGIGCGALLLIGIAAVVAVVFWVKNRSNATLEELQRLQGTIASSVPVTGGASSAELTGDCLVAYRCCLAIAGKTQAGAGALAACEVFKTPAYPQAICVGALMGYRKVAEQTGVACE